jgi:hypothetical protein
LFDVNPLLCMSFYHLKKNWFSIILLYLFYKGPVTVDIPTTRRVYESVKSGLEKIGVNYPIGKYLEDVMIFLKNMFV